MSDELADDLAELGLADEIADAPAEADYEAPAYPIWHDNIRSLNVFLALSTQWEIVLANGYLVRTRIIYEAIEPVLRNMNGIARRHWAETFEDLRAMESAALVAFNQEHKKQLERDQEQSTWRD
ncbi:DUF1799 domain-containing protein [Undibacterium sp. TJN25]|uniref:DUF1799 domain-containing protein n=1 Tax=Undibacterium sp. TJN25 TaxID=3413056 RepID=UPI003BF43CEB